MGWETDTITPGSSWGWPVMVLGSAQGWTCYLGATWSSCLSPPKTVQFSARLLTAWVVTDSPQGMARPRRSPQCTAFPSHSHPQPAAGIAFWNARFHSVGTWTATTPLPISFSYNFISVLYYTAVFSKTLSSLFVNSLNSSVCQDQTNILSYLIIFSVFPHELICEEGIKWRNRVELVLLSVREKMVCIEDAALVSGVENVLL